MKTMIYLISLMTVFISCKKEVVEQPNLLSGKWNLTKTELFQNDVLIGQSENDESSTAYYFDDCRKNETQQCEMHITEDGSITYYNYVYDQDQIILNNTTIFKVENLNKHQLKLTRTYDNFRSAYLFIREL